MLYHLQHFFFTFYPIEYFNELIHVTKINIFILFYTARVSASKHQKLDQFKIFIFEYFFTVSNINKWKDNFYFIKEQFCFMLQNKCVFILEFLNRCMFYERQIMFIDYFIAFFFVYFLLWVINFQFKWILFVELFF